MHFKSRTPGAASPRPLGPIQSGVKLPRAPRKRPLPTPALGPPPPPPFRTSGAPPPQRIPLILRIPLIPWSLRKKAWTPPRGGYWEMKRTAGRCPDARPPISVPAGKQIWLDPCRFPPSLHFAPLTTFRFFLHFSTPPISRLSQPFSSCLQFPAFSLLFPPFPDIFLDIPLFYAIFILLPPFPSISHLIPPISRHFPAFPLSRSSVPCHGLRLRPQIRTGSLATGQGAAWEAGGMRQNGDYGGPTSSASPRDARGQRPALPSASPVSRPCRGTGDERLVPVTGTPPAAPGPPCPVCADPRLT